jgi:HEAT repeat protein
VQLELGLRLFHPNAEVRKQLVQLLPEMRSLDATPWLLQLCRDPNPDVRRSAFSLMATTTDPRLVERLLQIARQDSDPTIRRHAERLASGRDEARRPGSGSTRR